MHDFRAEVNGWRQEYAERLATLEADNKSIMGNGQPGRLTKVEERASAHSRILWIGSGIVLAVQAGIGLVMHFWPWGKH